MPRKRNSEPKPEITPFAWRDPQTGVLYFETPFRRDFTTMFKDCVRPQYRAFKVEGERKIWMVISGYATAVEDLLESFWPEIDIDYKGWNPKNDSLDNNPIPPPIPR